MQKKKKQNWTNKLYSIIQGAGDAERKFKKVFFIFKSEKENRLRPKLAQIYG